MYCLNQCLREDNEGELKIIKPYIGTLYKYLSNNINPFFGVVYRGFILNDIQIDKYKIKFFFY